MKQICGTSLKNEGTFERYSLQETVIRGQEIRICKIQGGEGCYMAGEKVR